MNTKILQLAVAIAVICTPAWGQKTPPSLVRSYDNLADIILSVRSMESNLVTSVLDGHYRAALELFDSGDHDAAAAEMALFANEGDNAIGGVRKRLLEGGHHFNAEGEDKGVYEPGYVVVTRAAKQAGLAASASLRRATTDDAREAAWDAFSKIARGLLDVK